MGASDVSSEAGNITDATSPPPFDPSADRVTVPPENPLPTSAPPRRATTASVAVAAAVLGLAITLSFGYAEHDPKPHGVRVAVAATSAVRAEVVAGLQRAEPGGFDLVSYASAAGATQSVRSQSERRGLDCAPERRGHDRNGGCSRRLAATGGHGRTDRGVQPMHRPATLLDIAPLSSGDRSGLSSFVFGLGLLLPSVIGGVGIFLLGMRLRLWWRVAAATLFALLAACGGVLALDTVLGASDRRGRCADRHRVLRCALLCLIRRGAAGRCRPPGTALAAFAFIFVGNAISGGPVPVDFLPGGFRQVAPWLPNNAIVRGARDVVYFNGRDLAHPLLVLCMWSAGALSVLVAVDLVHISERRRQARTAHDITGHPQLCTWADGWPRDGPGLRWCPPRSGIVPAAPGSPTRPPQ